MDITGISWYSRKWPRRLDIRSSVARRVWAANFPMARIIFGRSDRSCRIRKRLAGFDFIRKGISIFGWSALDDIADVHFLARKTDRLQHPGQELAGAAYEGHTLMILIATRGLSNDDQIGIGIPDTEYDAFSPFAKAASGTITQVCTDVLHGFSGRGHADPAFRLGLPGDGWGFSLRRGRSPRGDGGYPDGMAWFVSRRAESTSNSLVPEAASASMYD